MNKNTIIIICIIIIAALISVIAFGIGANSSLEDNKHNEVTDPPKSTEPPTEPEPETEPETIKLTTSNIKDYLIFTTKVEDVEVKSTLGNKKGDGTTVVKVSSKKHAYFEDVKITFKLETSSSGWGTLENREIEISYDGSAEQSYKIYSFIQDYVSSNPSYKLVVTSVTGSVTIP